MDNVFSLLMQIALIVLGLCLFVCLYRAVRGPSTSDRVVAVKEPAEEVGVSKRTVQREMEGISYFPGYEVTLESKTGKGVWIEGTPEEKKRLLEELKGGDSYDVSNREERRKRLVLEILKDKGLKKLFYYASQFQVSEATISSDLEAVEGWLNT